MYNIHKDVKSYFLFLFACTQWSGYPGVTEARGAEISTRHRY